MSNNKIYKIYWQSKITGATGNGTTNVTAIEAKSWLLYLNKTYPEIKHWIHWEQ